MDKKARFMEAVAEKVGKRKPMMRRKPGMAVMIAIGGPKGPKPEDEMEGEDMPMRERKREMMGEKMGKAEKIAMLQEKIASLKAELALLEDEDEMDENEMEDEQEYEDEDED